VTLDRARQLPEVRAQWRFAGLILSEVQREHGQAEMDQLIREPRLEEIFGFKPGACFNGGLAI